MSLTKREWTLLIARHAAAALGLGLLLGFLGPFGSYPAYERGDRYAFWICLTLTGYLLGFIAWRALAHRLSAPFRVAAAAFVSSLPQAFIAAWAMSQVQAGRVVPAGGLPLLFLCVLATQLLLLGAIVLVERSLHTPAPTRPADAPAGQAGGRLAGEAGLIALEAQDHYLRVHTRTGSRLVLHRLSDGIADAAGIDGLQVHRGWWVASEAVTGTYVANGRRWLLLSNGLSVPVSRNYIAAVRSRNWPALSRVERNSAA